MTVLSYRRLQKGSVAEANRHVRVYIPYKVVLGPLQIHMKMKPKFQWRPQDNGSYPQKQAADPRGSPSERFHRRWVGLPKAIGMAIESITSIQVLILISAKGVFIST